MFRVVLLVIPLLFTLGCDNPDREPLPKVSEATEEPMLVFDDSDALTFDGGGFYGSGFSITIPECPEGFGAIEIEMPPGFFDYDTVTVDCGRIASSHWCALPPNCSRGQAGGEHE